MTVDMLTAQLHTSRHHHKQSLISHPSKSLKLFMTFEWLCSLQLHTPRHHRKQLTDSIPSSQQVYLGLRSSRYTTCSMLVHSHSSFRPTNTIATAKIQRLCKTYPARNAQHTNCALHKKPSQFHTHRSSTRPATTTNSSLTASPAASRSTPGLNSSRRDADSSASRNLRGVPLRRAFASDHQHQQVDMTGY
jgi:hypothetical protein